MAAKEQLILTEKEQMRQWSRAARSRGKTIALVPTMGYLHRGHLSLVQEAARRGDVTVISIYVNPGQFAPSEDLSTYPSDFHADLLKLKSIGGVDAVFSPKNLYDYGNKRVHKTEKKSGDSGLVSCLEQSDGGHETWVRVEKLEKGLCGKSRSVFFRGVATVVAKLFNIVEPDVALFGKKDYQQWRIIQRMARDLDFAIEIVGCEIERDSDGIALSSRNVHLSLEERVKALSINRSLLAAKLEAQKGLVNCRVLMDRVSQEITQAGGRIDYAEGLAGDQLTVSAGGWFLIETCRDIPYRIVDQETLEAVEEIRSPVVFCIAAWFGNVRLIDNMEINSLLIRVGDAREHSVPP